MLKEKLISCFPTLMINVNAVAVSMIEIESGFRILSYFVAIVWTTMKIIELSREWNNGSKKK